jgi:hypothetical protein
MQRWGCRDIDLLLVDEEEGGDRAGLEDVQADSSLPGLGRVGG